MVASTNQVFLQWERQQIAQLFLSTVQPVFVAGKAPPTPDALFENEVFFNANSSSSGIMEVSELPPLAFDAKVFSIDSK